MRSKYMVTIDSRGFEVYGPLTQSLMAQADVIQAPDGLFVKNRWMSIKGQESPGDHFSFAGIAK